jgi:hypothetical protein
MMLLLQVLAPSSIKMPRILAVVLEAPVTERLWMKLPVTVSTVF